MGIFTKNKNVKKKINNYKYIPLSPNVRNDDIYNKHASNLIDLIKNPRLNNIAVTGPYGSGKSTLVKTLLSILNKNIINKVNNFVKKITNGNIPCLIPSLNYINSATITIGSYISEGIKTKDETDDGIVSPEELTICNKVELSILKQLIYREKKSLFPKSKIKKLDHTSRINIFITTLIISFYVFLFFKIAIFNFKYRGLNFTPIFKHFPIYALFIYLLLFFILFKIVKYIKSKIKLININIKGTDIAFYKETDMVFNRYLSEIVYFFEVTKYNLLIFEDLDRFGRDIALKVIEELKELNTILNTKYNLNNITFIYTVRDNLFQTVENKNKFYDINYSILPICTASNSEINLIGLLQKVNAYDEISPNLIGITGKYITDMRTLINIVNDYENFKLILQTENCNKLFAMVVYKNYYYNDYNSIFNKNINQKSGNTKDSLEKNNTKENYIENLLEHEYEVIKKELLKDNKIKMDLTYNEIDKNEALLNDKAKILKDNLIQKAYLALNSRYPYNIRIGDKEIPINDFQQAKFLLDSLLDNQIYFTCDNDVVKEKEIFASESKKTFFKEYIELKEILKNYIDEYNNFKDEKNKIQNLNVNEIYAYYINKNKLEKENNLALLYELIANNYIMSDYMDYITSHVIFEGPNSTESLSYNDSKFMMNIRQDKYSFYLPLKGCKTLIDILKEKLTSPYILNNDLLYFVLKNNYKDELNHMFNALLNPSCEVIQFIINFLKANPDIIDSVFELFKDKKYNIWEHLTINKDNISDDDISYLFKEILKFPDYLLSLDDVSAINSYFVEVFMNTNIYSLNETINDKTIQKSILFINPRVKNLKVLNNENYNFFYNNNLYNFNKK